MLTLCRTPKRHFATDCRNCGAGTHLPDYIKPESLAGRLARKQRRMEAEEQGGREEDGLQIVTVMNTHGNMTAVSAWHLNPEAPTLQV